MLTRMETEKTFWLGMTEAQLESFGRLIEVLQKGDTSNFMARMDIQPSEKDAINETLTDLKEAVKQCQKLNTR